MLLGGDRISLPADVTFGSGVVSDSVRQSSWPVNPGGAYVLARSGDTLAAIAGGRPCTGSMNGAQRLMSRRSSRG